MLLSLCALSWQRRGAPWSSPRGRRGSSWRPPPRSRRDPRWNFFTQIPFLHNQVVLLDTLEQEISKFKECNSILDINALFSEAKHYHNKLVNIRKEMMMLHEKTSKLKKRALKLQQKRQKEELEREQQREKELEREKQLTAKPARRT
ncbi:biogenesis of lysosome-related organelles complex 1 subunit 6 isoform X2 [Dermochelys coriacea]|uniref:biogenesis of lysosome-related organelles complex 1 subunit 6 isoform X2 n=1 Tax=Dermochelys coriacea TaxID=27794 RepID=UPI0018E85E6C|nr:biogenesis of lysosome-related organelles complex 1 subunit 6 isoform X2 [Dermochelys coriacea]